MGTGMGLGSGRGRRVRVSGGASAAEQGRGALVVVTGCDSGIGLSLAELLHRRGYVVAVSYLTSNPFEGVSGVHACRMDLRVPADVEAFIAFVKGLCASGHSLAAVVDNAGVALGGPVEDLPMSLFREVFEINFFGAVRIAQAFIPELVASRGRIVVIGSMAGRVALPFLSPYASSKFALEGFCDSLRRELNPFGVRTILVEPAAVATPIWDKSKTQDFSFVSDKYRDSLQLFEKNFVEPGNQGMPADDAARIVADALTARRPRPRYLISRTPFLSKVEARLPEWIIDAFVARWFKMDYGRGSASGRRTTHDPLR